MARLLFKDAPINDKLAACGVEFVHEGIVHSVTAHGEVILCAGYVIEYDIGTSFSTMSYCRGGRAGPLSRLRFSSCLGLAERNYWSSLGCLSGWSFQGSERTCKSILYAVCTSQLRKHSIRD